MNPDPENFEQLRRLLVLKRYEQPPPGYFEHFSGHVIEHIRAEAGSAPSRGWISRFWAVLEAKPIFAGAFGVAVCSVLISGILNSEESGIASNSVAPVAAQGAFDDSISATPLSVAENPQTALDTNPISSLGALFNTYPSAQPAGLTTQPAGNLILIGN